MLQQFIRPWCVPTCVGPAVRWAGWWGEGGTGPTQSLTCAHPTLPCPPVDARPSPTEP